MGDFKLRTNDRDCWFLTKQLDVVKLISITSQNQLNGQKVSNLHDFYTTPLRSSLLNIFEADSTMDPVECFSIQDVKAKLFCIERNPTSLIFFPLLHSFNLD